MVLCIAPIFLRGLRHPLRLFFPNTFKPTSPDLTNCTGIEIQLRPHWFYRDSSLLNDEENRQYMSSLKSIMLVDPNDIKAFANEVVSAKYEGVDTKPIQATDYIQITGFVDSKPGVPFIIRGTDLWLKDNQGFYIFRNPKFPLCFDKIRYENLPFQRRINCAVNLKGLRRALRDAMGVENKYPAAAEWCDVMEQYERAQTLPKWSITWTFKCPAQQEGRCHYAMNPNCKPDSPMDMVLLFETTEGWNQHGGPELFTFDNHDPKGGCVLLNDGTVKFIRTTEELQQLRWK